MDKFKAQLGPAATFFVSIVLVANRNAPVVGNQRYATACIPRRLARLPGPVPDFILTERLFKTPGLGPLLEVLRHKVAP